MILVGSGENLYNWGFCASLCVCISCMLVCPVSSTISSFCKQNVLSIMVYPGSLLNLMLYLKDILTLKLLFDLDLEIKKSLTHYC